MKERFTVLLLILACSCVSKNEFLGEIQLNQSGSFTFFDFDSLKKHTSPSFTDYEFKRGEIIIPSGKLSVFLIDVNKNNVFNDETDALIFRDYSQKEPNSFSIADRIRSSLLFSINTNVLAVKKSSAKKENYYFKYSISKQPIDSVRKQNRLIDKIPDITISTVKGNRINLLEAKKEKFLYIDFWTTTCTPCIASIPDVKKVHDDFGDQIEVLSINSDDKNNFDKVLDIVNKHQMDWKIGLTNTNLKKIMDFNVYPKGYLFDEKGNLISSNISPVQVLDFLERN